MSDPNAFLFNEWTGSGFLEQLDTYWYRWENDRYLITFSLYKCENADEAKAVNVVIKLFSRKEYPYMVDSWSYWSCYDLWRKFKSTGRLEFAELEAVFNKLAILEKDYADEHVDKDQ